MVLLLVPVMLGVECLGPVPEPVLLAHPPVPEPGEGVRGDCLANAGCVRGTVRTCTSIFMVPFLRVVQLVDFLLFCTLDMPSSSGTIVRDLRLVASLLPTSVP